MKVVKAYPPNYAAIIKAIPAVKLKKNIIFTYGSTIYNPSGNKLSDDIIKHEEVHERQQTDMTPELWWIAYLVNKYFRIDQELEAYRCQVLIIKENLGRADRRKKLKAIINDFSGPMYDKMISPEQAKKLIMEEEDE